MTRQFYAFGFPGIYIYIHMYVCMYVACSFKKWRVSWQICIASLQESATWVYSRFHRWCNILEKVVVLLQQSVPPIYATCFSKSKAILKKNVLESATLLSSGPSTCVKTVVKTAVQPLWIQQTIVSKNACVCLRESGNIYSGRMKMMFSYYKTVLHCPIFRD